MSVEKLNTYENDIEKDIQIALEEVRPFLLQDNGDLEYRGFKNGVVYIAFQGACQSCPSSIYTLKLGIENFLKEKFSNIESVESVDMEEEEEETASAEKEAENNEN